MRALLFPAVALLAAGCSSAPPRDRTDVIADAIRAGRDAGEEAVRHLCAHAGRPHADALFLLVERGGAKDALAATAALAPLLTADDVAQLDALLAAKPGRALILIRESRLAAAGTLLTKHAKALLDKKETAKIALAALRDLRVRGATQAILDHLDGEDADADAACRALGRIWEQKLKAPPLAKEDEHVRLRVLLLLHGLAQSAPSFASCEAMLRVMTQAELEEFLDRHAKDRFPARAAVADVCAREGFDGQKGERVHRALLASVDPDVVALILWSSPHTLEVKGLLGDERPARLRGLPEARVCDYAAARLEAESARKRIEIPEAKDDRETLLKKWRDRP